VAVVAGLNDNHLKKEIQAMAIVYFYLQ